MSEEMINLESYDTLSIKIEDVNLKKMQSLPQPPFFMDPMNALPFWLARPLQDKMPLTSIPEKFKAPYSRGVIGENLLQSVDPKKFEPLDPSAERMSYDPLHDKHLKRFFKTPAMKKIVEDIGTLHHGRSACSLKEYNEYRKFVYKLLLNHVVEDMREGEQLERQRGEIEKFLRDAKKDGKKRWNDKFKGYMKAKHNAEMRKAEEEKNARCASRLARIEKGLKKVEKERAELKEMRTNKWNTYKKRMENYFRAIQDDERRRGINTKKKWVYEALINENRRTLLIAKNKLKQEVAMENNWARRKIGQESKLRTDQFVREQYKKATDLMRQRREKFYSSNDVEKAELLSIFPRKQSVEMLNDGSQFDQFSPELTKALNGAKFYIKRSKKNATLEKSLRNHIKHHESAAERMKKGNLAHPIKYALDLMMRRTVGYYAMVVAHGIIMNSSAHALHLASKIRHDKNLREMLLEEYKQFGPRSDTPLKTLERFEEGGLTTCICDHGVIAKESLHWPCPLCKNKKEASVEECDENMAEKQEVEVSPSAMMEEEVVEEEVVEEEPTTAPESADTSEQQVTDSSTDFPPPPPRVPSELAVKSDPKVGKKSTQPIVPQPPPKPEKTEPEEVPEVLKSPSTSKKSNDSKKSDRKISGPGTEEEKQKEAEKPVETTKKSGTPTKRKSKTSLKGKGKGKKKPAKAPKKKTPSAKDLKSGEKKEASSTGKDKSADQMKDGKKKPDKKSILKQSKTPGTKKGVSFVEGAVKAPDGKNTPGVANQALVKSAAKCVLKEKPCCQAKDNCWDKPEVIGSEVSLASLTSDDRLYFIQGQRIFDKKSKAHKQDHKFPKSVKKGYIKATCKCSSNTNVNKNNNKPETIRTKLKWRGNVEKTNDKNVSLRNLAQLCLDPTMRSVQDFTELIRNHLLEVECLCGHCIPQQNDSDSNYSKAYPESTTGCQCLGRQNVNLDSKAMRLAHIKKVIGSKYDPWQDENRPRIKSLSPHKISTKSLIDKQRSIISRLMGKQSIKDITLTDLGRKEPPVQKYYMDDVGNLYVLDRFGNRTVIKSEVTYFKIDKTGRKYFFDDVGKKYFVDVTDRVYLQDENGDTHSLFYSEGKEYVDVREKKLVLHELTRDSIVGLLAESGETKKDQGKLEEGFVEQVLEYTNNENGRSSEDSNSSNTDGLKARSDESAVSNAFGDVETWGGSEVETKPPKPVEVELNPRMPIKRPLNSLISEVPYNSDISKLFKQRKKFHDCCTIAFRRCLLYSLAKYTKTVEFGTDPVDQVSTRKRVNSLDGLVKGLTKITANYPLKLIKSKRLSPLVDAIVNDFAGTSAHPILRKHIPEQASSSNIPVHASSSHVSGISGHLNTAASHVSTSCKQQEQPSKSRDK